MNMNEMPGKESEIDSADSLVEKLNQLPKEKAATLFKSLIKSTPGKFLIAALASLTPMVSQAGEKSFNIDNTLNVNGVRVSYDKFAEDLTQNVTKLWAEADAKSKAKVGQAVDEVRAELGMDEKGKTDTSTIVAGGADGKLHPKK